MRANQDKTKEEVENKMGIGRGNFALLGNRKHRSVCEKVEGKRENWIGGRWSP